MSSPLIVPKFQFPSATPGSATAGFKVNTYVGGSVNTPLATWNSASLAVANANPVVMDANGQADIWLGNSIYKLVGTDASNNVLWTVDNVTQASLGSAQAEWVSFNAVPVFVSATSFSFSGIPTPISDLTVAPYFITPGTRIRTTNTGGTVYSTVLTVSANTMTLRNDSGVIDAGISAASYGIIASGINSSVVRKTMVCAIASSAANLVNANPVQIGASMTTLADQLTEFGTGPTMTAKLAGVYRVWGVVLFNEGAATTGIQNVAQSVLIRKNGAAAVTNTINWIVAASIASTQAIPFSGAATLAVNDTIDIAVTANFTGTAPTAQLLSLNIERIQ